MSDYTHLNLKDADDQATNFGLSPDLEFRMARVPLGLEQSGLSYCRVAPGFRFPFGHKHKNQEEVYVLVSGAAPHDLEGLFGGHGFPQRLNPTEGFFQGPQRGHAALAAGLHL